MPLSETKEVESPEVVQGSSWIGWLPIWVLPLSAVACRDALPPWVFMWILSFTIFPQPKVADMVEGTISNCTFVWRSAAYLLAWPGMDAEAFLDANQRVPTPPPTTWLWAIFETALGVILLWVVARSVPQGEPLLRGWVGMLGLILLLHFGTFQIVSLLWGSFGVNAKPIMSAPLRSTSLGEFWGKRWNLGFRQLSHELIFRPLVSKAGCGRGWLLGIRSFWAAPRFGDLAARSRRLRPPHTLFFAARYGNDYRAFAARQATWSWAGSARLVFHDAVPCGTSLLALSPMVCAACNTSLHAGNPRAMTNSLTQRFFDFDLWLVGAAHFVILFASFQVPYRLEWKRDLRQLMPFNRKLLWVQSGFTVLTIIAFGTLTLVLHTELLRGDRAALGLAGFIGIYWTARILVDALYFSHEDWPKGTAFVVGHALLTLLFFVLAASYLGLFGLARVAEGRIVEQ